MSFSASSPTGQHTLPRWPLGEAGSLYFAYGSNLHLSQMAQRCPQSVFKGKATLHGYKWQINERGVANVLESAGDHVVEGLIYLINRKDERALDRSEGVARGFYQKHLLRVAFEPDAQYADLSSPYIAQMLAQQTLTDDQASAEQGAGFPAEADDASPQQINPAHQVKALVYVSETYTNNGVIREEYISRMQKAASDALRLGISRSFIHQYIVPHLHQGDVQPTSPGRLLEEQRAREKRRLDGAIIVEVVKADAADDGATVGATKKSRIQQTQSHQAKRNSSVRVDLRRLKQENREASDGDKIKFPGEMLDRVDEIDSQASLNEDAIFVVLQKAVAASGSELSIQATSQDLELANELALQRFRKAYSQLWMPKTEPLGDSAVEIQPDGLEWALAENGCISITVGSPEAEGHVKVWVEANVISWKL